MEAAECFLSRDQRASYPRPNDASAVVACSVHPPAPGGVFKASFSRLRVKANSVDRLWLRKSACECLSRKVNSHRTPARRVLPSKPGPVDPPFPSPPHPPSHSPSGIITRPARGCRLLSQLLEWMESPVLRRGCIVLSLPSIAAQEKHHPDHTASASQGSRFTARRNGRVPLRPVTCHILSDFARAHWGFFSEVQRDTGGVERREGDGVRATKGRRRRSITTD